MQSRIRVQSHNPYPVQSKNLIQCDPMPIHIYTLCFWNLQNFSVNAKRSGNERNITCEEHRKGSRTNTMGSCVKYCKDIVLKYCFM